MGESGVRFGHGAVSRAAAAAWALAYAALLAHLLFLPYASTPIAFDEALRRFAAISWAALDRKSTRLNSSHRL